MNNTFTFAQLIDRYKIEIPAIQRDYAQGRNTQKATEIRTAIVNNFYNALEGGTPVDFDFIYGRIEDRNGTKIFIPIDGQQRLTTLFLLHLYLWKKCIQTQENLKDAAKECGENLRKFSYATRESSIEFCDAVMDNQIIDEKIAKIPETYIRDQSWFYPEWEKNPTIMGMLRTLNTIHEKFKDIKNPAGCLEKLTNPEQKVVSFQFKDLGLSDEIYLKMNARYLSLTSFENFKAKFEQYLEKFSLENLQLIPPPEDKCENWADFSQHKKISWKFDNDWLSGFWGSVEEKSKVSPMMMSAIANIFRFYALLLENEEMAKYFEDIANENHSFVSFDNFKQIIESSPALLQNLFGFMENLYQGKYCNIDPGWIKEGEKKFNLLAPQNDKERAVLASIVFYGKINKQEKFQDWLRVIWNIVENSTPDLKNLLTFIHTFLIPGCQNILEYLTNLSVEKDVSGKYVVMGRAGSQETNFETAAVQLKEECEKAVQIMNQGQIDNAWYHCIQAAEQYAFFHGCIRFLYRDDDEKTDWNNFDAKYTKARAVFDKKGIKEEHKISMTKHLVYSAFNEGKIWKKEQGGRGYFFNVSGDSWLNHVLKADEWSKTVDSILRNVSCTTLIPPAENEYLKDLKIVLEDEKFPWNYIITNMPYARFNWYDNHYCFYAGRYTNAIYVDCNGWLRNKILCEIRELPDSEITCIQDPIENSSLFLGYDILIKYKNKEFVWRPSNTSPEQSNIFLCNGDQESIAQNVRVDSKNKLLDILNASSTVYDITYTSFTQEISGS